MARDISDEFRQSLLESAEWRRVGLRLTESTEAVEEEVVEEEVVEEAAAEEAEADVHVCPLCVSQLDEAIDEDRLLEHLDVVLSLADRLSQLNEGEEDVESVIEDTLAAILLDDEDDAE